MHWITRERERRGWSRAELARRAGMNPSSVGKIECGRLIPYASQLRKIASALGVPENAAHLLNEELALGRRDRRNQHAAASAQQP